MASGDNDTNTIVIPNDTFAYSFTPTFLGSGEGHHGISVIENECKKEDPTTSKQLEAPKGSGNVGRCRNEYSVPTLFDVIEESTATSSNSYSREETELFWYPSNTQSQRCRGRVNSSSHKKLPSRAGRHDRYRSGYGSLSDAESRLRSQSSSAVMQCQERGRSPPPKYHDVFDEVQGENIYEEIAEHTIPGSQVRRDLPCTVIQTDEAIDRITFRQRENRVNAPDIVVDARRSREPFSPIINGPRIEYVKIPIETSETAKSILLQWVKKKPKLSKKAVEKCNIIDSSPNALFRYDLLSMTESREIVKRSKPYRGEKIEPLAESPIDIFAYDIPRPTKFRNSESSFKLTDTEKIEKCKSCNGKQKVKCPTCRGTGMKMCGRCHGYGIEPMTKHDCLQCSDGLEFCSNCGRTGNVQCGTCEGKGKVITFKYLKATWKLTSNFYIDDMAEISREKIKMAQGYPVLHEKGNCLRPIEEDQLLHERVNYASRRLISRHWQIGDVRKQKQTVTIIPVQEFQCKYKANVFSFFLVGKENQVYMPKNHKKTFSSLGNIIKNINIMNQDV